MTTKNGDSTAAEPAGVLAARENWLRIFGAIIVLGAIAYGAWRLRGVLVTILLALVFAYVLRPVAEVFGNVHLPLGRHRWRVPRWLATLGAFVLLGLALWGFWTVASYSIVREVNDLQSHWQDYRETITRFARDVDHYYRERLPASVRPTVESWVKGAGALATTGVTHVLAATFHGVGFFIELILVPILAFYFLADGPTIRQQVLFFVPRAYTRRTEQALNQAHDIFQRYIQGQVILCFIAFFVVTIGLYAIGVDFYLLLGVLAGLTRAVPIIGPVIGAIPIIIVVMATKSLALTLWVLAGFTIMHLLESKWLMPAILGRQLDLHPVLIIVALLVGAQIGGLLGVFLAAPLLAGLKVVIAQQRRGSGAVEAETGAQ
jgi:predicted PurR-regulated permease PerM